MGKTYVGVRMNASDAVVGIDMEEDMASTRRSWFGLISAMRGKIRCMLEVPMGLSRVESSTVCATVAGIFDTTLDSNDQYCKSGS